MRSESSLRRFAYAAIGVLVALTIWSMATSPTGWGLAWGDAAGPGGGIVRDR